ncbi:unnamed protein product [Ectocarpus sp. 6 AP-2014]
MFSPITKPQLVSELRDEANQKVQERETFLGGLRGLLFLPESTGSPESPTTIESSGAANGNRHLSPLPPVMSPPLASARMFEGPSIREVQGAVGYLREASLCVVEIVQAWRKARQRELKDRSQSGYSNEQPSRASSPEAGSDKEESSQKLPHGRLEYRERAGSLPDVRFPVLPTARPMSTDDEDMPTFLWFPSRANGGESGLDTVVVSGQSSLNPETCVPEGIGDDEETTGPMAAAAANGYPDGDTIAGSILPARASGTIVQSNNANDGLDAHHTASGINYLARMATDTDFIGAPGSVLAEIFPPDTKLYRNPFILGHNLDDTLALFTGNGVGSAVSPCARDSGEGALSPSQTKSRLDKQRVRLAAVAIVAEEAKERSRRGSKRHMTEHARETGEVVGATGDIGGVPNRSGVEGHDSTRNISPPQDGQRSDRSGSGRDDGHLGDDGKVSKRRRGKGGITFQDQQGEGGQADSQPGSDGAGNAESPQAAGKRAQHHHHHGKLKRGRKAKTISHIEVDDDACDVRTSENATKPGSANITKHSWHSRSGVGADWKTIAKATKEPAYKGPWVPVLLDTNVSCPEGIKEILSEDDVSWQLKAGDRIRIGCCTGHEWEVRGVIVVPNGKGKCRVALSEVYNHAKSMRPQHVSPAQDPPTLQHHHHHAGGHGPGSSHVAGARGHGEGGGRGGGRGPGGARLTKGGSQGGSLRHDRGILRTASSHSNLKAIAAEASSSPPHAQFRPAVASSSSAPRLPGAAESIAMEAGEGSRADPAATTHVGQHPADMPIPSAAKETRSEATPAVDGEDKGSSPVAPSVTATPGEAHPTTGEEAERSCPGGGATLEATSKTKTGRAKLAGGNKKQLDGIRRAGARSTQGAGGASKKAGGSGGMGAKHHRGGGGGREKGTTGGGESAEKHAARNLEIFEQNLEGLALPKGVAGKGAGGGRRRSLLGGYKAHSEAVQESRRRHPKTPPPARGKPHDPSTNSTVAEPEDQDHDDNHLPKARSRTPDNRSRRMSYAPRESERMPGAERRGGLKEGHGGGGIGGGSGVGGLAKCQRVWKMVPQARDKRPTWLRQYEDGSIPYGSHYQNYAGRRQKEVHFRVRRSWAKLELIVTDRPNARRFADFRPKQRYTFFRKLKLDDLLAIAYRETVASSGVPGTEHSPGELDLKSWHKFVVSLGFIADVSQPARHHDIEQIYRQRTRQYKAELRKLEAQAAKERERQLAEERAHARRLAAMGEAAAGTDDHKAQQQNMPKSAAGARTGTPSSASASAVRKAPDVSRSSTGARTASRGRDADGKSMGGATQGRSGAASRGGVGGRNKTGSRGNSREASANGKTGVGTSQRGNSPGTPSGWARGHHHAAEGGGAGVGMPNAAAAAIGVGEAAAGAPVDSVRNHQQVVMKHVLDQDLRMDLAGFKDALSALVILRTPELEQKKSQVEGLRDLVFNHVLIRPELEGVREMAWLQAKTWIRMAVKRKQYLAELRRLEALRIAALRKAASTTIQTWFRRLSWLWKFAAVCEKRRLETLRRLKEWRAVKRRKRRRREEAVVFRQSRDLNGCMVLVSMSKKGQRGLDVHVRAYVPVTQETFRFVITEKALHAQLCRTLKTESLSGAEIVENLDKVAARLSCRKQRNGRRWVVSRAKRVAAESGSLVYRVASRLDGVFYFFKVYRSATDVAVTAYEPKRCETLRVVLPIRGARGISVWIEWEVETATLRRRRELSRRLGEVQKASILKLHEMNVEIERPKLLAARRLGSAVQQREAPLPAADTTSKPKRLPGGGSVAALLRSATTSGTTSLLKAPPPGEEDEDEPPQGPSPAVLGPPPLAAGTTEAPPTDAELTGMGALPFVWYDGAVPDLELFGDGTPLETDEVASSPDIDITARGREVTLARWVLRRIKVDRVRVVEVAMPSGGGGGRGGWDGSETEQKQKVARRPVARWQRVLVTFYEIETQRRNLAASRVQGLSRMWQARDRARSRILSQFEKRFDVYSGKFYYHSNKTKIDTFVKPSLLRPNQDLEEPADEWIEQKDRSGKTFYTNPATGQRSFLSVPEAAAVIVKACRYHLQAFYGIPGPDVIERGIRFSQEAEEAWVQGGGRLASTLNYALVLHTHLHDLDTAGPLYDAALELSGENPLVQRACGLFLLSSCRFPREQSRAKGLALLSAADYRDRDLNTFALAEGAFFHFGLLSSPKHARALLNWALVLEHVRRDPAQAAELFYRRAIATNDLDPHVLANYKSFCMERLPGGLYPGGGPGSRILRRSRLDGESLELGAWKRYRDPAASEKCLATFWFHSLQQETSWQGPPTEGEEEIS